MGEGAVDTPEDGGSGKEDERESISLVVAISEVGCKTEGAGKNRRLGGLFLARKKPQQKRTSNPRLGATAQASHTMK